MATKTVNLNFLGVRNNYDSDYAIRDIDITADDYCCFLKFKTPEDLGSVINMQIQFSNFTMLLNGDDDSSVSVNIQTSENGSYIKSVAKYYYEDINSVSSTWTMEATNLSANTEYYVKICLGSEPSNLATLQISGNPIIALEYALAKGIYIEDDSAQSKYWCYIDTEYIEYPTNDVNCTIVGQCSCKDYYASSEWESSPNYKLISSSYCSVDSKSTYYYAYWLNFITPNNSNAIKITFNLSRNSGGSGTYYYAICTSDANYQKYEGEIYPVSDKYQVVSGECTLLLSDGVATFDIATSAINPNTTYYLVMWAHEDTSTFSIGKDCTNHTIILTCEDIDNPIYKSKFDKYTPYIDNGTSWEPL